MRFIFKKYSSCVVRIPCVPIRVLQYMLLVTWILISGEQN